MKKIFLILTLIISIYSIPLYSKVIFDQEAAPPTGYANDNIKPNLQESNNLVIFDKSIPSKQRSAVLEIANAIRSGKVELIRKYTKKGQDPNVILNFWRSVDQLSNLKFQALTFDKGISLSEAKNRISSCDLIYEGNRLVIGECTNNDGN
jgi:hypothetical protein